MVSTSTVSRLGKTAFLALTLLAATAYKANAAECSLTAIYIVHANDVDSMSTTATYDWQSPNLYGGWTAHNSKSGITLASANNIAKGSSQVQFSEPHTSGGREYDVHAYVYDQITGQEVVSANKDSGLHNP